MNKPHLYCRDGGWFVRTPKGGTGGPFSTFANACWALRVATRGRMIKEAVLRAERERSINDINPRAG